jgi:hypothetical protein
MRARRPDRQVPAEGTEPSIHQGVIVDHFSSRFPLLGRTGEKEIINTFAIPALRGFSQKKA